MQNIVLVVGASGFVGKYLLTELVARGRNVRVASRKTVNLKSEQMQIIDIPDLTSLQYDWTAALQDVDCIVYLAARVHVMNDNHPQPLLAYRAVNKDAPIHLAKIACQKGVKRFVYLSSVKVMGESSERPFTEEDQPNPIDPYGISKLEAEQELLLIGKSSNLEVTIIRPPLVYGFGVKANFMELARIVELGLPIPIGAIQNKRSMVYIENLVDAIALVLEHPAAANEVFLVSDDEDISTPELARQLGVGFEKAVWLPNVPIEWLKIGAKLIRRTSTIQRLTESLQISSTKIKTNLGWTPPYTVSQGLLKTVESLKLERKKDLNQESESYDLTSVQIRYLNYRTIIEKFIALLLIFLSLPIVLILCILIKLDSKGPIFFIQKRIGYKSKTFNCFKFRTMKVGTPNISTEEMQKTGLNPITRIGYWLRRTSFDELPQILNILLGQMSFIGPRPALPMQDFVVQMRSKCGADNLPPGITGLAQVRGRDSLIDDEKVKLDYYYYRQLSFRQDMGILYETIYTILSNKGNK